METIYDFQSGTGSISWVVRHVHSISLSLLLFGFLFFFFSLLVHVDLFICHLFSPFGVCMSALVVGDPIEWS